MTELSDFHLGLFVTVYIAFWIPPLSLLVLIVGVYFENARSYLKRYAQKCQCPLHSSCPSPSPVSPVPMNNQSLSVWSLLFVFSQNKQIHVYFLTSAFFFFLHEVYHAINTLLLFFFLLWQCILEITHVILWSSSLFFLTAVWYSFVWIHPDLFIHFLVYGHLGCFYDYSNE